MQMARNLRSYEHLAGSYRFVLATSPSPLLDQLLFIGGKKIDVPYRGVHVEDMHLRSTLPAKQLNQELRRPQRTTRAVNRQRKLHVHHRRQ
jgi:hypothetical protein